MGSRRSLAISGRFALGAVLGSGVLLVLSPQAQARPQATTYFVSPGTVLGGHIARANAGGGNCTSQATPCATIAQAVAEEAANARGTSGAAVISLARGTYSDPADAMFHALGEENDNLTVTGAGKATVIKPTSCSALSAARVGPDAARSGSAAESAIVDLDGLHGVTIENMAINGGGLEHAGCQGSAGYKAAVLATGASSANVVDNVTISAGTTYGIQMDDQSQTQLNADVLQASTCSSTLRQPAKGLKAGWKYNQSLVLSKVPSCASGFTGVMIHGISYTAMQSTSKTVVLTSGPTVTPDISKRSTIVFDTSVPAYTGVGIACNTLVEPLPSPTSCSVSSTTVMGGGTVYTSANSPVGILVTNGGTARIHGDKVLDNSDLSANGIGIGLLPDTVDGVTAGPTTIGIDETSGAGSAETLSGNDISILGSAFPSVPSSSAWAINGNSVGGNEVGILLSGLTSGSNIAGVSVSANNVTGTVPGAGIELADVVGSGGGGVTIGGATAALGNNVTGNGLGIAVTQGTTGVSFTDNTVNNNVFFGVAVDGQDAMHEFLPGLTAGGNSFSGNTWTGNGNPVTAEMNGGANVVDFSGFTFPTASVGGSASAQANDLTMTSSITAGTTPSSITLSKASGLVELGPGTLVNVTGYCAPSTFTCNGTNVSLFVTALVAVGTTPVVVDVAPIAPVDAKAVNNVVAGAAVSTNQQVPLTSTNVYSGDSCTPAAPNTSTTLAKGTGGGQTGYDAC